MCLRDSAKLVLAGQVNEAVPREPLVVARPAGPSPPMIRHDRPTGSRSGSLTAAFSVIRVRAAALNFFDTLVIRGKYQFKPELPFSPGSEAAGDVEGVGPGRREREPIGGR